MLSKLESSPNLGMPATPSRHQEWRGPSSKKKGSQQWAEGYLPDCTDQHLDMAYCLWLLSSSPRNLKRCNNTNWTVQLSWTHLHIGLECKLRGRRGLRIQRRCAFITEVGICPRDWRPPPPAQGRAVGGRLGFATRRRDLHPGRCAIP